MTASVTDWLFGIMSRQDSFGSAADLPSIWIVIPCFNEERVLPLTAPLFEGVLDGLAERGCISSNSKVCFVDDGSSDATWEIIENLSFGSNRFCGVKLSRNEGHQNALLCGLMEARLHCDAAISLDCDGQDDPNVVGEMVERFVKGDDIVFGVRSDRTSDTFFKRFTAQTYYKLLNAFGVDVVYNHADCRLMSKRALDGLSEYREVNLFLRGIVPLVGFRSSIVEYARNERVAGESHYPIGKMVHLAVDGITSFSTKPLRIVALMGIAFSLIGLAGLLWALISVALGRAVAGWASTMALLSLIGGVQLVSLGIIGEYVGKIYLESKRRPRYHVDCFVGLGVDSGEEISLRSR